MPLSWRSWIANEGSKHFILVLWLGTNTALFWKTFVSYCSGPQHYYLHKMLGLCLCMTLAPYFYMFSWACCGLGAWRRRANLGLCVSRASAAVLKLNCCLVLLPVCRSLLAGLRGFQKVTCRKTRRILDKRKTFHVACGIAIGLFSVIHVSAHLANVYSFSVWYSDEFPALNLARYRGEDPRIIMFTTVPGATGVLLVLVLFLMFTASSYGMRVANYDIFWYTHNLSIIFYILLLFHVIGGVLKYQTNVEHHPPDCFRPNRTALGRQSWGFVNSSQMDGFSKVCREDPQFQAHFPETWLWVSGPLCLYCAERLYRYMRGCRPVTVASVVRHPCRVVEVHMLKSGFRARPGQYIVLNCPHVSSFESHPFTLTTCPTKRNATFGIHLRVLGDWTERFTDLLLAEPEVGAEILPVAHQRRYPRVYVDGPFGSPSEDVFNYEVSVCVAGGIGVTPFASVLQALLDDWQHHKLKRLYFIWVCRELQSFCWFSELLCTLHQKLWQENRPDYLNIKLYVSKEGGLQSLSEGRYQVLSARLLIGRPRWELLFEEIGRANKQKRVGVFCSGPKGLSKTLHKMCNSSHFGATFEFNKESFS